MPQSCSGIIKPRDTCKPATPRMQTLNSIPCPRSIPPTPPQRFFLGLLPTPIKETDMDNPPKLVNVDSSSRCSNELITHPARCSRTLRSLRSFLRSSMRSRTSTQSAFQFSMLWNSTGSASGGTNSWHSVSTARILIRRCRSSDSLARMSSSRSTISFSRSRMRVAAVSARSMRREWRCWAC